MKTVRFSRVVEAAGQPRVHTLWVAPEKDAEFKRARDAQRLMTLTAARGKTDAGVVGYDPAQKSGEFLIFPKSLARFDGARVVGIKFDLVDQPKSVAAKRAFAPPPKSKTRPKKKAVAEVVPFASPAAPKAKETRENNESHLVREVRAALRELEAGKSVAAYRRLEKAIAD